MRPGRRRWRGRPRTLAHKVEEAGDSDCVFLGQRGGKAPELRQRLRP